MWAKLGRYGKIAVRVLLGLLVLNGMFGLLSALAPETTLAELARFPVHGDLRTFFLEPHSPLGALQSLFSVSPLTMVVSGGVFVLVCVGLVFLNLSALVAMVLAVFLLVLTLRTTGSDLWGDLREARGLLLLVPVVLFGTVLMITVHRWGILLHVQGVDLSFWLRARLTMIGMFFNIAIPGAVGGDLLKMAYVTRKAKDRKTEAVLTIMLDRVMGILALFIVASVSVLVALPSLLEMGSRYAHVQAASLLIGFASVGGVAAVLLVEFREAILRVRVISLVVKKARAVLPDAILEQIDRMVYALDLYRENRLAVVRAVAWSMLVHTLLSISLFSIGRAVGEESVSLRQYFLTTQVANTVAAIPITPGGVGTRDATTAAFLSAFDATPADKVGSIPVIMSLVIVFWGLVGAVVFIFSPEARHTAHDAQAHSADDTPPQREIPEQS
jgi:uncharacterized protein (TIRG00374 family)